MLGEEQIRTVCTVLIFDYLFINVQIPVQDIDSFFLVPIIDSPIVGFLSPIIDSPLVFLSEWSFIDIPIAEKITSLKVVV
jgi:hypothetical protein